mmetsp:Transcript_14100/g.38606  ORF Transcript_14100/g.38606 Transcript_14100/m.38606 type:complete len:278 (+) Transcript_14100:916-1749(+)
MKHADTTRFVSIIERRRPRRVVIRGSTNTMASPVPAAEMPRMRPTSSSNKARPPNSVDVMAHNGTTSKNANIRPPCTALRRIESGKGLVHSTFVTLNSAELSRFDVLVSTCCEGIQRHSASRAQRQIAEPTMPGNIAGNPGKMPYVHPPMAGPSSWMKAPPHNTFPTTSVCLSCPPISIPTGPRKVAQPLPRPRNTKRTASANSREPAQRPNKRLPSAKEATERHMPRFKPYRPTKHPQRLELGMRPMTLADCNIPATYPALSLSAAQPMSAVMTPA